jgi:hypothetical protein
LGVCFTFKKGDHQGHELPFHRIYGVNHIEELLNLHLSVHLKAYIRHGLIDHRAVDKRIVLYEFPSIVD